MRRDPGFKRFWIIISALFMCMTMVQSILAADLTVRVQPSGDSFAKAYVITGEARTYFGNVEGGTSPYEYKWEFSNGGNTGFASLGNPRYISYDSKVFDAAGTQWVRLTVRDSSSPQLTSTATINLQVIAVADDNLTRQKNSAIDRSLRYLYTQEQVNGNSSQWYNNYSNFAGTGMALVALENHGHNLQSPDSDIYKKSVQQGVQFLLNNAVNFSLSDQECIGNPEAGDGDSDNDGIGVHWDNNMYHNPIAMLALINSCDKATAQAYIAQTTSGDVNGQTLWDIIVDAKDYLAWAQNDKGNAAGSYYLSQTGNYSNYGYVYTGGSGVTNVAGYFYLPDFSTIAMGGNFTINWGDGTSSTYTDKQHYNYGTSGHVELNYWQTDTLNHTYTASGNYDISVSYTSNGYTVPIMGTTITITVAAGEAACSLADASGGAGGWRYSPNYGSSDNSVTQWPVLALTEAKKRWDIGVNPLVNTMLDYWLQYSQSANGSFCYASPGDWNNFPKTAAGTIMLNYLGLPQSNSRVTSSFSWLDTNWSSENYGSGYSNMYSMYAFYKGMKSWGKADFFGRDWEQLYTQNLVSTQTSKNTWNTDWEDTNFATFSALAILAPEVASLPPVANAGGPYADVNAGQNVSLNGSASYHQDPARSLVKWEWDFEAADGLWWDTKVTPAAGEGAVGMNVNTLYADAGTDKTYTVTLRVTDNTTPTAMTDTDTETVKVTSGNVAPVAVTNGPWSGLPGQAIIFDGSVSYDPNAGAPLYDHITLYEWDLDGDGIFNETNGDDGTPVAADDFSKVTKSFATPVSLPATLRVTDSFGKAGTSTATANIISIAVVYGQKYEICYRTTLNRFQEKQGLRVTFKNQGNTAAENLKMTLTSLPSNMTIFNNKSFTQLGTLNAGQEKSSACNATAKTADIEVIFDRRIVPVGSWFWRGEFDFNGNHYVVDNIPPLGP